MLTETTSVTHLGYVQERKVLFFIKNFIEADFFPLRPDPNPYFISCQMVEEFALLDSPKCCMLKDTVLAI